MENIMIYTCNELEKFAEYYPATPMNEFINYVEEVLKKALDITASELRIDLSDCEIKVAGSLLTNSIVDDQEPIDFVVKIRNNVIIQNDVEYLRTKKAKAKQQILSSEVVKNEFATAIQSTIPTICETYIQNKNLYISFANEVGRDIRVFLMINSERVEPYGIDSNTSKKFNFDFYKHFEVFNDKSIETNNDSTRILNIIKYVTKNNGLDIDTYFLETLIFNIPTDLYVGPLDSIIIKVINYLLLSNKTEYVDYNGEKLYKNTFFNISLFDFISWTSNIAKCFK